MEDILSSIKRIIAEEGEEAAQTVSRRGRPEAEQAPVDQPAAEEVLELTDEADVEEPTPAPVVSGVTAEPVAQEDGSILSVESEVAARHSLSALSSLIVTPREGDDNTLDGLVRSMLKPMLKEWLDARLPALVQDMVAKEIARITAR